MATKLVQKHELKEARKGPSGSFTPDNNAYSILYRRNHVKTIILKVTPIPGGYAQDDWRSFSRALPFKLTANDELAVLQTPEYRQQSLEFRRSTQSLKKAAEEENLDAAALAYVDVALKCVNCHQYIADFGNDSDGL